MQSRLSWVPFIGATALWDPWDASPPTFEQVGTAVDASPQLSNILGRSPPTFENCEANKSPKCTPFGIKCSKLRRFLDPDGGGALTTLPIPPIVSIGTSCLLQSLPCVPLMPVYYKALTLDLLILSQPFLALSLNTVETVSLIYADD